MCLSTRSLTTYKNVKNILHKKNHSNLIELKKQESCLQVKLNLIILKIVFFQKKTNSKKYVCIISATFYVDLCTGRAFAVFKAG